MSNILMLAVLGESEYWFALIKVLMIILFIFVGLIYDWGAVKGHPGPVGTVFVGSPTTHLLVITSRVCQIFKADKHSSAASKTLLRLSFTPFTLLAVSN